jgi:ribosomal protein S18 acetylase RimI-like enzyme
VRVRRADSALARRQAAWIAAIDPWRALGYQQRTLARWLSRSARARQVQVLDDGQAIIVVQPDVLLGSFIALLAVRPERAGQGLGRALVEHVARQTFKKKRWLYVSSDLANKDAAKFYRRIGFEKIARIPDLVRAGHTEVLWRRARPS